MYTYSGGGGGGWYQTSYDSAEYEAYRQRMAEERAARLQAARDAQAAIEAET
eukprot:CAMPEP_0174871062 /NCGR_PEP_ID=MMETSP1114-20130205/70800_1 /TAXON_ID=312471 /ORGANISM="Neobodo designis, Strain CCAP 1951/1" /LENGTH=51 /DNA_ID=CAMNT_0016106337 /DNA_START=55 /DNA_END=207 /DNA_ORIENTATION=+